MSPKWSCEYMLYSLFCAQMMAAHAFQRRVPDVGITFSTVHPGLVSTDSKTTQLYISLEEDPQIPMRTYCLLFLLKVNTTIVRGFGDVKILKVLAGGVLWSEFSSSTAGECVYLVNCSGPHSKAGSSHQHQLCSQPPAQLPAVPVLRQLQTRHLQC